MEADDIAVAGADGCPAGWVCAFRIGQRDGVEVFPHFAELVAVLPANTVIAVDMPIGLPKRSGPKGRAAERSVRPLLGRRSSSVFSVPSREAVYAPDYETARRIALLQSDPPRSISKQAFMIFPKIREIDQLLRGRPSLQNRIIEGHPEVAFRALNREQPVLEGKKMAKGAMKRRAILRANRLPIHLVDHPRPKGAGADDVVDALVMLAIADRYRAGRARPFPDPPERDAYGLPIAIWV